MMMEDKDFKFIAVILAIAVAIIMLAGCGGGDGDSRADAPPTIATAQPDHVVCTGNAAGDIVNVQCRPSATNPETPPTPAR
jgi:hypothetical protein